MFAVAHMTIRTLDYLEAGLMSSEMIPASREVGRYSLVGLVYIGELLLWIDCLFLSLDC